MHLIRSATEVRAESARPVASPERHAGVAVSRLLALTLIVIAGTALAADDAADSRPVSDAETAAAASAEAESQPSAAAEAQSSGSSSSGASAEKKGKPLSAYYKKGIHIETEDNKFKARIRWRVQMRFTDLTSDDLVGEEDGVEEESGFQIRRARFKLDGHVYEEWLKYYLEYGIAGGVMLTFQFDVDRYEKASLRVGQYKVRYNRERIDSSGKQEFVDRSIVNNPFTIDRQQGLELSGRLFKDTIGDSRYVVGVFTGTGRGGGPESDGHPMYVGRWQWNFLGRDVPFTQSDIKYTPKTIASFALAGASNQGQYTRWSSSGGGQLPGFDDGEPDQYKTDQWMAEFSLMRKGLFIQGEYHQKRVDDTIDDVITKLHGFYGQVGYFFHSVWEKFPKKLEFAVRYARVDSDEGVEIPADREATFVTNYFFSGQDNKLTADISHLESTASPGSPEDDGIRVRVQWDISF